MEEAYFTLLNAKEDEKKNGDGDPASKLTSQEEKDKVNATLGSKNSELTTSLLQATSGSSSLHEDFSDSLLVQTNENENENENAANVELHEIKNPKEIEAEIRDIVKNIKQKTLESNGSNKMSREQVKLLRKIKDLTLDLVWNHDGNNKKSN